MSREICNRCFRTVLWLLELENVGVIGQCLWQRITIVSCRYTWQNYCSKKYNLFFVPALRLISRVCKRMLQNKVFHRIVLHRLLDYIKSYPIRIEYPLILLWIFLKNRQYFQLRKTSKIAVLWFFIKPSLGARKEERINLIKLFFMKSSIETAGEVQSLKTTDKNVWFLLWIGLGLEGQSDCHNGNSSLNSES